MSIRHIDSGSTAEYEKWDEVFSLADGRRWHACPVCGGGLTSPADGPNMAHADCIESVQ